MSKMSELDAAIRELHNAAEAINSAAEALADCFSETKEAELTVSAPVEEAPKSLTLPDVRAILAEKSRGGHREKVRELLLKYGSDKLSGIDPARYEDLVTEAEGWTDAT